MTAYFIFPLIIFLTLAGLLFIAISYPKRETESKEIESAFLLQVYFIIAFLISSFAIFWGSSLLIKAGIAYQFGLPFSYQGEIKAPEPIRLPDLPSPVPATEDPMDAPYDGPLPQPAPDLPKNEKIPFSSKPLEIVYAEHIREKDMLQGSMFLLFGLLFFVIHQKVFRYMIGDYVHIFLKKSYHLIGTLVYGGITLVSIPMALYTILERMLFKEMITAENMYRLQFPGELLGYAIPGLIIWYLFFTQIRKKTQN